MVRPLVVADQRAIGLAAGRAELGLVDLLEEFALVELDRLGQVAVQLALGQVQHAELERRAGLRVHDEIVQAPPAPLELAELGIVHDDVELLRQLGVDRRDRLVEGARQVAVERDRAGQGLLDQRLDQLLGTVGLRLLGVGNDLVEETRCRLGSRGGSGAVLACAIGHGVSPPPS